MSQAAAAGIVPSKADAQADMLSARRGRDAPVWDGLPREAEEQVDTALERQVVDSRQTLLQGADAGLGDGPLPLLEVLHHDTLDLRTV